MSGAHAPTTFSDTVAAADREFLALAISSDGLETEAARLALEKSRSAHVRTFAQRMIDDSAPAADGLRQAASRAGIAADGNSSTAHVERLEKLRALSGMAFDREYAAEIGVAGLQEAIALFERASREAANADVRAIAEQGLPDKREHLALAQSLAKSVGVPGDRLRMALAPPDLSSLSATIASAPVRSSTRAPAASGEIPSRSTGAADTVNLSKQEADSSRAAIELPSASKRSQ